MPLAVETIGTGETFTTVQSWEDALDAAHAHRGECKAEVFSSVEFNGQTYTSSNFPTLTSVGGAEHDGRAHEVSGAGNARIEFVGFLAAIVRPRDSFIIISWLEIKGPGDNTTDSVLVADPGNLVHHCILHNNHASTNPTQIGWESFISTNTLYRNSIYGMGGPAIFINNNTERIILLNTVYECNLSGSVTDGGIHVDDASSAILEANGVFDNPNLDLSGIANGIFTNHATSDATATEGTNNLINLTATDQFVNATTTFANTDLLLKAGSDLIGAAETTYSSATYPEIDESIDNRGVSVTGIWSIGASHVLFVPVIDVLATVEPLTLTEFDASVNAEIDVLATVEALTLIEFNPSIKVDININANRETLTLVEHNANINAEVDILASSEALTLTEFNAAINAEINVNATFEELNLVEYGASVKVDINIEATKESLILAEHNAGIAVVINISTNSEALTLAEFKASVNAEINVNASLTQLSLAEYNASVVADIFSIFRTLDIVAESRVLNIIDESRILGIIAENRALTVIAENRELTL